MGEIIQNQRKDWKTSIFHDGGSRFVEPTNPKSGELVQIRIQYLKYAPISKIFLSLFRDGEELNFEMHPDPSFCSQMSSFFPNLEFKKVEMHSQGKELQYRFRILTEKEHFFYSTLGISRTTPPEKHCFRLIFDAPIPKWIYNSVFYQIFPDRFYNGNPNLDVKNGEIQRGKEKSVKCDWEEIPGEYGENYTSLHFYGGDLEGIRKKIPYLQELGINALYLNPIFKASTNHKYNTENYYQIDPHLGTNEEFASLVQDLHKKGIRIILDAVINHTGDTHPWFNRTGKKEKSGAYHSQTDPHYEFYHFYSDDPESYDAWKNFKLLPRLNFTSDSLKNKIYRDEDSILQFWMRPPYNIDGWRFDCANMIGKYEKIDLSSTIWQDIHYNLKNINEDSLLLGETFYDGSELISPEKLDAITNYTAFYSPLVRWLSHQDGFQAFSNGMFRNFSFSYPFSLHDMISQMQLFRGLIPFQYQLIQLNLLDGHDVPRMYSVLKKDEEMMKMAVCMLFTYPGIPLIYYGDEIGMEGINDPANRRPMVWDESKWHKSLREFYIRMIKLRKDIVEFQTGSFFIFKLLPKYEKLEIITYARLSKNRCYLVILQKSSSKDSDSKQNNVEIEIPLWQLGYESGKIIGVIEKGKEGENLSKNYSSGIFRIENSKIFPYFIGEVI